MLVATGSRYVNPYALAYTPTLGPIPGATLTFYLTGSSTLAATYSDAALTYANSNPVVADATGTFPDIFLDPAVVYKAVLQYPANGVIPGAVIYTADPAETVPQNTAQVPAALTANGGAALIGSATGQNVESRLDGLDTEVASVISELPTKANATQIGSMLGALAVTTTGTLPAVNIGYLVELVSATAATLTLPTEVAGDANQFVNNGAGIWTLAAPSGGFFGCGISGLPSSIKLGPGAGISVTFDGTNWAVVSTTLTLISNANGVAIGMTVGARTYYLQFCPIGFISGGSSVAVTYPIAFGTAILGYNVTKQSSGSINDGINMNGAPGLSTSSVVNGGTSTSGGSLMVFGY